MVKMSHRRHDERMKIKITKENRENRQNIDIQKMTEEDCRSKANGALQHKIWKPGELEMTNIEQHDEIDDQLQNKVWYPGILKTEGYDQEVIFLYSWGV